jgi:uncharacterized membrane protein YdcZ (DUF606 family)
MFVIDLNLVIGIAGMLLILFAFIMNQLRKWNSDTFYFDLLNFVGASLLGIYALLIGSWPFLVLQLVWAIISLKDLVIKKAPNKKIKKI